MIGVAEEMINDMDPVGHGNTCRSEHLPEVAECQRTTCILLGSHRSRMPSPPPPDTLSGGDLLSVDRRRSVRPRVDGLPKKCQ